MSLDPTEVDTGTDVGPIADQSSDVGDSGSKDVAAPASFVPNSSRPSVPSPPDLPAKS